MQKTLFSKHFITIAAIILLSITILGAVLLAFASQYFKQDRYRLLEHNAQQAAELTYADFRSNLYQGVTPAVVLPRYTSSRTRSRPTSTLPTPTASCCSS